MPHLPPRPRHGFPVAVDADPLAALHRRPPRLLAVLAPHVPEQVRHRRRPPQARRRRQPLAAQADDLSGELRKLEGLDRQVPAVVRPRGDLVDDDARPRRTGPGDEALDAQHADEVESGHDLLRDRHGFGLDRVSQTRGHGRHVEDVVAVAVRDRPPGDGATKSVPRRDHAHLRLEGHHRLEHARLHAASRRLQVRPCVRHLRRVVQHALALAVVAAAGRLEHAGEAQPRPRRRQLRLARHRLPARDRHARRLQERFLLAAVLRHGQHVLAGPHRPGLCAGRRRRRGHVLELVAHAVDRGGETPHRVEVAVSRGGVLVGHLRCGAAGIRREHVDPPPAGVRRLHEHPSQLPAAEHAQG